MSKLKYRGVKVLCGNKVAACVIYLGKEIYQVASDPQIVNFYLNTVLKWTTVQQVEGRY